MFKGIEHFAIASPNPKSLAEWYVDTLGFEHTYEYQGNYFIRAANGALIEIIRADAPAPESGPRTAGMRHIAIAVDDFEAAHQALQSKKVEFTGAPFENEGNRLVFFKDRDGNLVHLIHRQTRIF